MLQLLNSIWLLAIGAIVIPLAIHLWNVKKGKTLKIGSIQLVGESSRQNSRSLRLHDLWLLILRCLMLVVLALLLAGPVIYQNLAEQKIKGWVLVDEEYFEESYSTFKPRIDSLVKNGYETHYFNIGFKEFNLPELQEKQKKDRTYSNHQLSHWSLVKALDSQLPENMSAYIFTSNRLNRFTGHRPELRSKIIWETYSPADSVYNKISDAYITQTGSLRLLLGHSQPLRTTYSLENTSIQDLNPAYQLTKASQTGISFNKTGFLQDKMDSSMVSVDTATMQIALFTDKYTADLNYVKAALQAVQTFSQRKMTIKSYSDPDKIPVGLNWLFWLSEVPLRANGENKAQNIFSYQAGNTIRSSNSAIDANNRILFDLANTGLYQRKSIPKTNSFEQALWEDGTASPLLTMFKTKNSTEFKFYSRFDPEWNDLVWSPKFPEVMLSLISYGTEKTSGFGSHDRRTIAFSQIKPASLKDRAIATEQVKMKQKKLEQYFWVLLMALLAIERWVSYKQKSITANG